MHCTILQQHAHTHTHMHTHTHNTHTRTHTHIHIHTQELAMGLFLLAGTPTGKAARAGGLNSRRTFPSCWISQRKTRDEPAWVQRILGCGGILDFDQKSNFFFFLVGVVTRSSARAWQNEGKKPKRLGKGKLLPKTENPPWKNHSLRSWPTLARAQAKSVSEEQTEKGLTL